MTMLFDANKRLIKVNDIYPEDVQLAKGDLYHPSPAPPRQQRCSQDAPSAGVPTHGSFSSHAAMRTHVRGNLSQPPALQCPLTRSSKAASW